MLGSITGPGIWFAATIASPRGISALIHSFVWLWASEWVFFVIEVIGVYLLVYLAGRVDPRTHTRISIIFGLASVATLLVIVGILSFMLWPGPVSYTHLDVYKRQVRRGLPSRKSDSRHDGPDG